MLKKRHSADSTQAFLTVTGSQDSHLSKAEGEDLYPPDTGGEHDDAKFHGRDDLNSTL